MNEEPNADTSLVMQGYPLLLISVHLTLQCIGNIGPNLQSNSGHQLSSKHLYMLSRLARAKISAQKEAL